MRSRQFLLDALLDSAALFKLTHHFAHEEGTCLLYSGGPYETAQCSYLFLFPYDCIKIQAGVRQRCRVNKPLELSNEANPWKAMQNLASEMGKGESSFPEWVGFFGYEMGAFSDHDVVIPHQLASTPEAYWQRCAVTLMLEHASGKATVQFIEDEACFVNEAVKEWVALLSTQEGWQQLLKIDISKEKENSPLSLGSISETQEKYLSKIEIAKEFIKSGDVYQINLSQQWEFLGCPDPFDLFKRLALLNPAPFSAYFHTKEFSIVSSSPERFLQKKAGLLETRPIKGTAPRGRTPADDETNKRSLLASEKEQAELTMITDLMRNDLGKISVNGSVEVPLLCGCEAYHNVFHLYSIVRSRVLSHLHPLEIIRACFPGGSITGCPKLRAMEIIAELEQRPRGIYTGAIGYLAENGDFDLNIAIRTVLLSEKKVNLQLGGGIVIDSNPIKEYEEIFHKGRSIFEILNADSV